MAKFLDTTGVNYHLQQLINQANEKLILISPFLQLNERLKQSLEDKDRLKIDIRIIYGKSELQPAENNWLKALRNIRTSYCQNLHAKCYLSENAAIITSMNLYEFSQINNNEMGVFIDKAEDLQLYADVYAEAMRLVRISDEIKISVAKVPKPVDAPNKASTSQARASGFCIRCGEKIKLNPMAPYCRQCYNSWKKFENEDYKENKCHICGKPNQSSLIKPSCYQCYLDNRDRLEFPLL